MKFKIIFSLLLIAMLFVLGCTSKGTVVNADQIPEGVDLPPKPAGSEAAVAGQGYSTGSYDRNYQLYNNIYADGSTIGYLVDGGQWVYLRYSNNGQPWGQAAHRDLNISVVPRTTPNGAGTKLRFSSACANYEVEMDGSGNYIINRSGVIEDRFNVPLNRYNAVLNRQIGNSEDAITVHSASSGVGWFTLHCDIPTAQPVCGNGVVEVGEQCDDGNRNSEDGCNILCRREASTPQRNTTRVNTTAITNTTNTSTTGTGGGGQRNQGVNEPPQFDVIDPQGNSINSVTITAGETYAFNVTARDDDDDQLNLTADLSAFAGQPWASDVSFNVVVNGPGFAVGQFRFDTTRAGPGSDRVNFTVTDGRGGLDVETVLVIVG